MSVDPTTPKGTVESLRVAYPGAEVQTDKPSGKVLPCRECGKELIVNVFYAPASARCAECRGATQTGGVGTQGVVRPGATDPAKAVNLHDCLVNKQFATALCPVHPDDEEHVMELKSVSHSEHYGPSEHIGYKEGRPVYRQIAPGETVMHQCLRCKATVSYSTTAQVQFRRQNEPRTGQHVNGWARHLGARPEPPPPTPEDHAELVDAVAAAYDVPPAMLGGREHPWERHGDYDG